MSDTQEPQPPKTDKDKAKVAYVPGQPLPRLWKTEPDPEEDSEESLEEPGKAKKKVSKDKAVAAPASKVPSKPKATTSKPAKPKPKKKKVEEGEDGEKRVLLEETPRFDTIESRQRARLAVGGLITFCFLILGWIVYGMIFSGSGDFMVDAVELPSQDAMAMLPGPKASREPEARYMLDRAREYAKRGKTKESLAMLERVVSVYKGTQVAGEAQAALDRPSQGLPLFPDGPYVVAERRPVAPARASKPPPAPGPAPAAARPAPPPGPEMLALARPGMNPAAVGPAPAPVQPSQPPPASLQPRASQPPSARSMPPPSTSPPPPASSQPPPASSQPPPSTPQPPPSTSQPPPASSQPPPSTPQPPPSTPQPPPASSQPPPAGPGDAVVLIPANPGNAATMPPAGGNVGSDAAKVATGGRTARTLPPGFTARDEAGVHESGWPWVIVGERDGGKMVLVPGGIFMMGSDSGNPNDGPAHLVRLSTYYIDQYEITNRQFRTFLKATGYHGQPPGKWLTDEKHRSLPDNAPVVDVSYHDAEEYAIWALKRLPTEAQWEMAARSPDGRRYPWGDQPIRSSRAWKFRQVDAVDGFPEDVSPFGVFDMAGNAHEWVRDWYDSRYFHKLRGKTTDDPAGPPAKRQGIQRVVKGASKDWLVVDRQGFDSDSRLPYLGFRCSLAVEGGEASANIVPHTSKPDTSKPGTNPPGGEAAGSTVPF